MAGTRDNNTNASSLGVFERVPKEIILVSIASFLRPRDICRLRSTSQGFNRLFATHFKDIQTERSPVKRIMTQKITNDMATLEQQKKLAERDKKKATQESVGTIQSFFSFGYRDNIKSENTHLLIMVASALFLVGVGSASMLFILATTRLVDRLVDYDNVVDRNIAISTLIPVYILAGFCSLSGCCGILLCAGVICRNTVSFFNSTNQKSNAEHRIAKLDDALKRVEAGQARSTLPDASMNAAAAAAVCLTDADEKTPLLRTTSARP